MKQQISVFWFRRDLRLNDNHGLFQALKNSQAVLPIFIFDTHILNRLPDKKDKRINFIHQTLEKLNEELIATGSSLYIFHGKPLNAFKKICGEFEVKAVFTNQDYEPYAIERDEEVKNFLSKKNILFHSFKDQVIFEKAEVMKPNGEPYHIFTPYSKAWKKKLADNDYKDFPSEKFLSKLFQTNPFPFISLKEIGFEKTNLKTSKLNISNTLISGYDNTRNFPAINGTTYASLHLRFGTVSIRQLVKKALQLNETWLNELIWREFFMMILFHYPRVVDQSFKKEYDNIKWRNNEKEFELWCKGETGYPLVDAGMRQLNETGEMHNRVRMVVASFLTKHLLIDWRWGEAYFAEKLLDYELSSNNGNWQWVAGTGCDAAPYFRIFNPSEQIKKFDPQLAYVKKWIKNFHPGYLPPIVDHDFARKRALVAYTNALKN